jgi:hypothetical protein
LEPLNESFHSSLSFELIWMPAQPHTGKILTRKIHEKVKDFFSSLFFLSPQDFETFSQPFRLLSGTFSRIFRPRCEWSSSASSSPSALCLRSMLFRDAIEYSDDLSLSYLSGEFVTIQSSSTCNYCHTSQSPKAGDKNQGRMSLRAGLNLALPCPKVELL